MAHAERFDLVIRGGTVHDGTGAPGVRADVAVRGERIAAVGAVSERGTTELGAGGMAVTPGFIDVHSHDDFAVLLEPEMPFKVMQGVTTDIVGNCGSGVVPYDAAQLVDRGVVRPGAFADLVVFDPATIRDVATYQEPRRVPEGMRAVIVSGVAVARDGRHTGARPGRAVRRGR